MKQFWSATVGVTLRFLAVGALNTLFGLCVYWLMLRIGMAYQFASAVSLVLGIVFSFNSYRALVFRERGRFIRYVLVWVCVYAVNIALISALRESTGDYYAGVILVPVNAAFSYILMRQFVFQKKTVSGASP